jgi:hypothetical protein
VMRSNPIDYTDDFYSLYMQLFKPFINKDFPNHL